MSDLAPPQHLGERENQVEIKLLDYQAEALRDESSDILLHGGRGSAKSHSLVMMLYNACVKYPGGNFALACNDYEQLRDSTRETWLKWLGMIGCPAHHHKVDKIFTMPNGSRVHELTLNKDKTSLKGPEWDGLFFDEADGRQTTEEKFDYLIDCCRGKIGDRRVRVACNPVSHGHFLAKRFFINPQPGHKGYMVSTYMNRANLPDDYIPRMEAKYPPGSDEHKRWMMGELVTLAGAVYKMWGQHLIVKPEDVPSNANMYVYGQDLGVNDPHVLLEGRMGTNGILYITQEYYKAGMDIVEHLPYLKSMYAQGPVYSDHSATQHSIMLREGFQMVKAMKDVHPGIQMVANRMLLGGVRVSTNCPNLINELYLYCWKDLPNSPREEPEHKHSHSVDAARYMIAGLDGDTIIDGL